jgi:AFG3 family protein
VDAASRAWKNFPKPKSSPKSQEEKENSKSEGAEEKEELLEKTRYDSSSGKGSNEGKKRDKKSEEENDKKSSEEEEEEGETPLMSARTVWMLVLGSIATLAFLHWYSKESATEIYYQQFVIDLMQEDLVERLEIVNGERVRVFLRGRSLGQAQATYYFNIPNVESFERKLDEVAAELHMEVPPVKYAQEVNLFHAALRALPTLLWIGFLGFVALSITRQFNGAFKRMGGSGGPGGMFNIGKSRAKRFTKTHMTVQFKDVAGCDEAKVEIQEFVNFLKNPKKYQDLGAKIPKGALLTGPPGTGKTLLAKATAGEANVPFYSVAGSDFLEMFVGVGPSRVRDLFAQARENAPCIIFIDEIDAIGRQRGGRGGSSNDERENTLNQLLVEMDGFSTHKKPIIVLAGTNRPDILDKALLRPGRFDRNIALDLPDIKARKDIFMVHLPKLKLQHVPEYYSGRLAAMTPGFSGADVANLCNEAALIAARKDCKEIVYEHFEAAVDRVIAGLERRSMALNPIEKKTVAFHEAGHVITAWHLEHGSPLLKVSIIPRGPGLGYAMYIPEDRHLYTKAHLMDMISVTLGGRAAEELTFGVITTGAQDDLQKVTEIAYSQLLQYGMSDTLGPATFGSIKDQGYVSKNYSEETAALIDREVRELVAGAYERSKAIIMKHHDGFDKLANTLMEREVLTFDDCKAILGDRPFAPSATHAEFLKIREDLVNPEVKSL